MHSPSGLRNAQVAKLQSHDRDIKPLTTYKAAGKHQWISMDEGMLINRLILTGQRELQVGIKYTVTKLISSRVFVCVYLERHILGL